MKKLIYVFVLAIISMACAPYGELSKMEFSELKYPFGVKYITLDDGRTIAYADKGEGKETIIFLHGLGSYMPAWQKNIPVLAQHFRTIAVDLPGYGKSSKEVHSGSMEFYADVIIELADKLNLKKITIAGHSMGGQIAMVAALKYPDRVSNLILIDPAGFEEFTPGEKEWFKEVMTVDGVALTSNHQIRTNVYSNFYNMPDDAEFMITDRIALKGAKEFKNYAYTVVQSVKGMVDEPVIDHLSKIKQRTLIIFGEDDQLIPNRYLHPGFTKDIAEIGRSKIRNSILVMIPECGHFAQFEKPGVVNDEIIKFLTK
ncbi:MAG: alpha/beta hydrolase [Ignavibacteria bacterium]|nr:MAG: alpha/beta hydrolase [Ignavibacteria bacterium]